MQCHHNLIFKHSRSSKKQILDPLAVLKYSFFVPYSHTRFDFHPLMLIYSLFSFSHIYTALSSSLHCNYDVLKASSLLELLSPSPPPRPHCPPTPTGAPWTAAPHPGQGSHFDALVPLCSGFCQAASTGGGAGCRAWQVHVGPGEGRGPRPGEGGAVWPQGAVGFYSNCRGFSL